VAQAPDTLTFKENRDKGANDAALWVRRGLLALVALIPLFGLANAFGQRPATTTASGPRAELQVYAPVHARSGLVYAARFTVRAIQDVKKATLVLAPGWADGYTFNGSAPQPVDETSRDGKLAFDLGHVAPGHSVVFWASLQINPTNVGRHSQTVELDDGETPLVTVHRTILILSLIHI